MGMHHDIIINKQTFPSNRLEDLEDFCKTELLLGAGENSYNESQFFIELDIRKFGYGGYQNKEKLSWFLQKVADEDWHYDIEVQKRHEDHKSFREWDWKDIEVEKKDLDLRSEQW